MVENAGICNMLKTLEIRYVIQSRCFFANTAVPKLYRGVKLKVKESLKTAGRVVLTCDIEVGGLVDDCNITSQRTGNCNRMFSKCEWYMKATPGQIAAEE